MLNNFDSLLRLIKDDKSEEFKIIVIIENIKNIDDTFNINVSKQSKIIVNTSINKARVISSNINQNYANDQAIKEYEIRLNNITEKNKTEKISQIFHLLLNSIGKQITISSDIQNLFMLVMHQLGESFQPNALNMIDTNEFIEIISYYRQISQQNETNKIIISAGNNNDAEYRYNVDNLFKYDTANINDFYYKFYQHPNTYGLNNARYIEFNFLDDKVRIQTFEIHTNDFYNKKKSIEIVGSNDHLTWNRLVYYPNYQQSTDDGGIHIITLQNKDKHNYYQYIRYIEIDESEKKLPGFKTMQIKNIRFIGEILNLNLNETNSTQQNNSSNDNEFQNENELLGFSDLFTFY